MTGNPVEVSYVTRKYPPSVGGMETLARNTSLALDQEFGHAGLFKLGRSNRNLLWWVPVTAVRLVGDVLGRRSKSYLFGDALAWTLLGWIPRAARVPAFTMVCGLDITYRNPLYRAVVYRSLRKSPRVLAISAATLHEANVAGVAPDRGHVITMGVTPQPVEGLDHNTARTRILATRELPADAILLLTTGRLVRRKGVAWFTREVMPLLDERFHYLIVGTGADDAIIREAADATGIGNRVHLLGYVTDAERAELLVGSDFFVQPNVPVSNDMEGFGLVVVESAQADLLTVASDIEGLRDAVRPGETGFSISSGAAKEWADELTALAQRPDRAALAAQFGANARRIYSIDVMGGELGKHVSAVRADR